jgi:hypothetical protein
MTMKDIKNFCKKNEIEKQYIFQNTDKSRYLELGYVEYPGCVELSGRSRVYLLYK